MICNCEICGLKDSVFKAFDDVNNKYLYVCEECVNSKQVAFNLILNEKIKKMLENSIDKDKSIKLLINDELIEANNKFSAFNSTHEGSAIISEEIEESIEEINKIIIAYDNLWAGVMKNSSIDILLNYIKLLEEAAFNSIKELIQVAAMCKKFKDLKLKKGD